MKREGMFIDGNTMEEIDAVGDRKSTAPSPVRGGLS